MGSRPRRAVRLSRFYFIGGYLIGGYLIPPGFTNVIIPPGFTNDTFLFLLFTTIGGGGGGLIPIPIPTNITTIIKALIFIIIIIQQQSYRVVAGHDGQYNCHAFTFWGSGTTVTGITNTNVKSPQCLLMLRIPQCGTTVTLILFGVVVLLLLVLLILMLNPPLFTNDS